MKSDFVRRDVYVPGKVHLRSVVEADTGEEKETRTIEGYAIIFNAPSVPWGDELEEIREVIAPEAVTREMLDGSDIKMTMYHDNKIILARSKQGEGTLSYEIDNTGVKFSFEAPHTSEGNAAIELVKRGDIDGCSFAFALNYRDKSALAKDTSTDEEGNRHTTYTIRKIERVFDFTLTPDPAYPATMVEARDLASLLSGEEPGETKEEAAGEEEKAQIREMRDEAEKDFFI